MKIFIVLFMVTLSIVATGCTRKEVTSTSKVSEHEDPEGYYTCPMHHQIHQHSPGTCPICGMPLVKTSGKQMVDKTENESEIRLSEKQMQLAAISKYTVTRKNVTGALPLSGRLISAREISFQVYESDLSAVHEGGNFKGTLSSTPNEVISGKIHHIENMLDPSTRTVSVLGTLTKPVTRSIVDTGFYGEVEIQMANQLTIPEDSVFHSGERDLVYVFTENNKLQPRTVVIGKKVAHEYPVLSGVQENEVISAGANFLIDSETKIRGGNDKTDH
jgi:Cu(I)/Ag(I) efflux system membrane fusion protein